MGGYRDDQALARMHYGTPQAIGAHERGYAYAKAPCNRAHNVASLDRIGRDRLLTRFRQPGILLSKARVGAQGEADKIGAACWRKHVGAQFWIEGAQRKNIGSCHLGNFF